MPRTLAEYLIMPIAWKRTRSEMFPYQTQLNFSADESEILSIRPVIMMSNMNELWVNGERLGIFMNPPANWGADDGWLTRNKLLKVNNETRAYMEMPLDWEMKKTIDEVYALATGPSGEKLGICLGSFPDEPLYALLKDDWAVGDFYDWPKCWKKSQTQ